MPEENFRQRVALEIDSARPLLWVHALDMRKATADLGKVAEFKKMPLLEWTPSGGLCAIYLPSEIRNEQDPTCKSMLAAGIEIKNDSTIPPVPDPRMREPVDMLMNVRNWHIQFNVKYPSRRPHVILVLRDIHRYMLENRNGSSSVIDAIYRMGQYGAEAGMHVIILSSSSSVPAELSRNVHLIEDEMPSGVEMAKTAKDIDSELTDEAATEVAEAGKGLTRSQFEQACAYSWASHGHVRATEIVAQKIDMIKRSRAIAVLPADVSFDTIGGLDQLKTFMRKALRRDPNRHPRAKPRGINLVGPPGCGKTAIVKALGLEVSRPVLALDMGAVRGQFVGQSEEQLRAALRIADSMEPCILFIDEINHALGSSGSNTTDGGLGGRLHATMLSWMSDHKTDVFLIGTCNTVVGMDSALSRAGRMDAIFFIDIPTPEERQAIWAIHGAVFGYTEKELAEARKEINDKEWTGAEVETCCRLGRMLDCPLSEAARMVRSYAASNSEELEKLREIASASFLSASVPGFYNRMEQNRKHAAIAEPGSKIGRRLRERGETQ